MEVRTLNPVDLNMLSDLQPEGWQDIITHYDFYTNSSFCFPLKVLTDDKIVGIGSTIIHKDVAWLCHIIVHKDHRNKGIGLLITKALIESLKGSKCETIYLIATDLGAPVYQKAGFETETEYLFFNDVNIGNSLEVSNLIEPYKPDFKTQITSIDQDCSGEDRMFHLQHYLQKGFVYCRNNVVGGFYLPTLGDGLIVADSTSAGIELLKLHLKSNNKVALPQDNLFAVNYLYGQGFKEVRAAKRMRLGKQRPLELANIYNRIGGNLG